MLGQDPVTYRRSMTADRFPCDTSDQANDLALPLPSTTKSYSSQCDIAASSQAFSDNVCRHAEPFPIPPEHRRDKGPVDGTAVLGPPSCPFLPPGGTDGSVDFRPRAAVAHTCQAACRTAVPRRLSIRYRQRPSAPRRATSLAVPSTCTCLPSGPVPSIDQSTTIWAISPFTNTWRALASSGRPRLRSRSSSAAISARSVTVRPSSAMTTAPSYKVSIALNLPELNRSISDGMTPSGSVGSRYDLDMAVSCSCWLN